MRYARLFADRNGESHFDVQSAAPLDFSPALSATQGAFMRAPAGWASDFHVSSARNMFFVLSGEWEVSASDGESRRFAVGSALLVEDTYPTIEGLKQTLDVQALTDPRASKAKVEDLVELRFVDEMKKSGFIDKLYGRK